jgi:DNA-binding response OmpR family regulator
MSKRILAIDDDELVLLSLEELLATEGHAVTTAPGGQLGLEAAARERFDLVLLDLVMPGMSGFEVCRALRAMAGYGDVPIIMLTAKSTPADREQGLAAGATLFLPKPIHPVKLVETVRQALQQRS